MNDKLTPYKIESEFANMPKGFKMPDSLIKALNSGKRQLIIYHRGFGKNTAYKLAKQLKEYKEYLE